MFCDQCGKQMPDDSVYCPSCGAKNSISTPEQEVYSELQPVIHEEVIIPQPVVQPQPVQQPIQNVQQPVQQKVQPSAPPVDLTKPISVLGFMGTLLLLAIPIVGLVMTFIWAFGSKVNKNRKHLAIALLIFYVIGIVLGIVFGKIVFDYFKEMFEELTY